MKENKTMETLEKAVHEMHRMYDILRAYSDDHGFVKMVSSIEVDYNDPDQEFLARAISEFEQYYSRITTFITEIDKPVSLQGKLQYDYSEGKYKIGETFIEPGRYLE